MEKLTRPSLRLHPDLYVRVRRAITRRLPERVTIQDWLTEAVKEKLEREKNRGTQKEGSQ